jgi:hypothetical protein
MSELHDAWSDALPGVLRLTVGHRRDLFRHELQAFLARAGVDRPGAESLVAPLQQLLLTAARAARQPAAISATRRWTPDVEAMAALATHLLSSWRAAEDAARTPAPRDPSGMTGEVFFGPRLGGPGRDGALVSAVPLPAPDEEQDL